MILVGKACHFPVVDGFGVAGDAGSVKICTRCVNALFLGNDH